MSAPPARRRRALVLHRELHNRIEECGELWQYLAALHVQPDCDRWEFAASDCRHVFAVDFAREPEGALGDARSLASAFRRRHDVVIAFGPLPWYHLLLATLLRLRGARVVFFPLSLLSEDFSERSWFVKRSRSFGRVKPYLVRVLARCWSVVATTVVCASQREVRTTRLPEKKVVLLPWPTPATALARRALEDGGHTRDPEGPVAIVSRFDPERKGFDRVCTWLERYGAELPRPAALLLAPRRDGDPTPTAQLQQLLESGLLAWDDHSTGAALLERLRSCRGQMLLSRWEGQPRALRESLLIGLPVVTTPSSNLDELLPLIDGGFVVDGDDPAQVHDAFRRLERAPSPAAAARLAFSSELIGRFLLGVLDATAAGRRPAPTTYYEFLAVRVEGH